MSVSSQQHSIVTIARTHLFFPQETWVPLFRCPLAVSVPSASSGLIERLSGYLLLHLINCCAPLARVTHVAVYSLKPSTIVPVSTSCPLALHSLLVLHLRSLPASFHPSSACHLIRRAHRFLFFFLPTGLPSPTVAPSHILRDVAVPSIAPIGPGFALLQSRHSPQLLPSGKFCCCCLNLTLAATRPRTGITPQEQGRGKDNTSAVEFSKVCTVSCACARLFFYSVSFYLLYYFLHVPLVRAVCPTFLTCPFSHVPSMFLKMYPNSILLTTHHIVCGSNVFLLHRFDVSNPDVSVLQSFLLWLILEIFDLRLL